MNRPTINSTREELIQFVHGWIQLCANGNIDEAFRLLDPPLDEARHAWSMKDFEMVVDNYFEDGKRPVVTDPDTVAGEIRKNCFEYNDGSGWSVEYDLPLNGVVSSFTLLFDFIKVRDELKVILDDCHIL